MPDNGVTADSARVSGCHWKKGFEGRKGFTGNGSDCFFEPKPVDLRLVDVLVSTSAKGCSSSLQSPT